MSVDEAEACCGKATTCKGFTFDLENSPRTLLFTDGTAGSTNNLTGNVVNRDPIRATQLKYEYVRASALAQQVWGKPLPGGAWAVLAGKPLPGGAWAVLAINGGTGSSFAPSILLSLLNMTGPVDAVDVWTGEPAAGGMKVTAAFAVPSVPPRASGLYKLVPSN